MVGDVMMSGEPDLNKAIKLVRRLRPLLVHQHPDVVAIAISDLAATFIACHHPELRADTMQMLFELIEELMPLAVREINNDGKAPAEWRQ